MLGKRFSVLAVAFVMMCGSLIATQGSPVGAMIVSQIDSAGPPLPVNPGIGQFVPVTPFKVLDTRTGFGGSTTLSPNQTITIQVAGIDPVPEDGVSAVFMNFSVISPTESGYISDFSADSPDPAQPVLGFQNGQNANGSDVVQVPPVDSVNAGEISITNYSSGTIDLTASVRGFYTDSNQVSGQDTYVGINWLSLLDTRSGADMPGNNPAVIGPNSTLKVNVSGQDGLPYGIDSAQVLIAAITPTSTGYLTDETSSLSGTVPSVISYNVGEKDRIEDVVQLASDGSFIITNHSTGNVSINISIDGYYIPPASSNDGAAYVATSQSTIYDSRAVNGAHVPLPANSSISIQETGQFGIPSTGVKEVSNVVSVINAQATGWLAIYETGEPDSNFAVMNFQANDAYNSVFDETVATLTSATGSVTITNDSPGTVDIELSSRGYWQMPTAPSVPTALASDYDSASNSATLTWAAPATDGGASLTGYVMNYAGTTLNFAPTQTSVIIPSPSSTDTASIAAVNGFGSSSFSTPVQVIELDTSTPSSGNVVQSTTVSSTSLPVIWSGSLVEPSGGQAVNAALQVYASSDLDPSQGAPTTSILLASGTTDASGNFALAAEPTSALAPYMAPDGTVMVNLLVDDGGTIDNLTRTMTVELNGAPVSSSGQLGSMGPTDSNATASWVTTDITNPDGSAITLPNQGNGSTVNPTSVEYTQADVGPQAKTSCVPGQINCSCNPNADPTTCNIGPDCISNVLRCYNGPNATYWVCDRVNTVRVANVPVVTGQWYAEKGSGVGTNPISQSNSYFKTDWSESSTKTVGYADGLSAGFVNLTWDGTTTNSRGASAIHTQWIPNNAAQKHNVVWVFGGTASLLRTIWGCQLGDTGYFYNCAVTGNPMCTYNALVYPSSVYKDTFKWDCSSPGSVTWTATCPGVAQRHIYANGMTWRSGKTSGAQFPPCHYSSKNEYDQIAPGADTTLTANHVSTESQGFGWGDSFSASIPIPLIKDVVQTEFTGTFNSQWNTNTTTSTSAGGTYNFSNASASQPAYLCEIGTLPNETGSTQNPWVIKAPGNL